MGISGKSCYKFYLWEVKVNKNYIVLVVKFEKRFCIKFFVNIGKIFCFKLLEFLFFLFFELEKYMSIFIFKINYFGVDLLL